MRSRSHAALGVHMVYVLARMMVKEEAADAAGRILTKLAMQSRQETGCLSYDVYRQAQAPHVFQTVEQWRDKAAFDAHMKTAHGCRIRRGHPAAGGIS
jgi:quinol monooxygenase YgiN